MKKIYLILAIVLLMLRSEGQYLPSFYITGTTSYQPGNYTDFRGSIYGHDSVLYLINNGGVQILNTQTGQSQHQFHNFYPAVQLAGNGTDNVCLLKGNNTLASYNYAIDSVTIITSPVAGAYIHDIGRSATQTWILADSNIVARYNGQQWSFYTTAYNAGNRLLVQNDSTAYVLNDTKIMRIQNDSSQTITALPLGTTVTSWDVDNSNHIWCSTRTGLIRVDPSGHLIFFSDTAAPFNRVAPINVLADDNGNVWAQTTSFLYKFNNLGWTIDTPSYGIAVANIDRPTGKIYGYLYNNYAFTLLNGSYNYYYLIGRPLQNIKAGNYNYVATDAGIFSTGYNFPNFYGFNDTTPYATDVTCFSKLQRDQNYGYWGYGTDSLYGTHHGIYSFNGIPFYNNLLPDSNINCIRYFNNQYYVGTNTGCCIINQGSATCYNTGNAPLPSNKVTAIAIAAYYNYNTSATDTFLWIGTDNGVALKCPGGWKVFDTATLHLNSFYVSDIAFPNYYDTLMWVSTLGQGLIKLDTSGNFLIMNSHNQLFQDDTIYYINTNYYQYQCVYVPVLGTSHSGIAVSNYYSPFEFYSIEDGYPFHSSKINGDPWLTADSGYIYIQYCEAIATVPATLNQLRWHQQGNQIEIFFPETYNGRAELTLLDIQGRSLGNTIVQVASGIPVTIPAGQLSSGIYLLQCSIKGETLHTKLTFNRE